MARLQELCVDISSFRPRTDDSTPSELVDFHSSHSNGTNNNYNGVTSGRAGSFSSSTSLKYRENRATSYGSFDTEGPGINITSGGGDDLYGKQRRSNKFGNKVDRPIQVIEIAYILLISLYLIYRSSKT
jgi:hypothetical protein